MPTKSRKSIKRRSRYFVACEGKSEFGYVAFIRILAEDQGSSIHLDIQNCSGGDPLKIVEIAIQKLQSGRKSRGDYLGQIILLDADRRGDDPDRTNQADRLIMKNKFLPIWSNPTFEKLMLNHLPGCRNLKPQTARQSLHELQKHWPEYEKGMSAMQLNRKLDISAVEQAATVEPALHKFLVMIGLISG